MHRANTNKTQPNPFGGTVSQRDEETSLWGDMKSSAPPVNLAVNKFHE